MFIEELDANLNVATLTSRLQIAMTDSNEAGSDSACLSCSSSAVMQLCKIGFNKDSNELLRCDEQAEAKK